MFSPLCAVIGSVMSLGDRVALKPTINVKNTVSGVEIWKAEI